MKIPVYIVTGFLGSGKTTVLKKMLRSLKEQGKRPALIMNELGSENVEKEMFEDEAMIELLNGCICCTIQEDMRNELQLFLSQTTNVDVIIIEGTGIANPAEIVEALTHPELIDLVKIVSIIGMVDASRYLEYQSLFQSSKEIRTMLKQQIESSALLIMNKMDLIDQKKEKKVRAKIEEIKRREVPIVYSTYGDVSEETLLETRFLTDVISTEKSTHHHHHDHHHHTFQAIKIEGINSFTQKDFEKWLKSHGPTLLRAKGYITFLGEDKVNSFQYAANRLEIESIDIPKQTCIILIGTNLNKDVLDQSLSEFVQQNI
ncbi:hypothetical protein JCM9140_1436 [Halalkalibacter wakoensis JCM 9140]|uniref:CobW C-terminal domain-containing protein n=1 Tax=Halalkalibacter wakoensis JCM 9140 TaxID=1236970 RepID=W4Q064_9BACI|nr:GTP-binding protein [Halalkalibacter wakoensis]GAE25441.1 hypothetical protein JCM9140_1436 [Halalkalibacter wakoensis JCM 9140]